MADGYKAIVNFQIVVEAQCENCNHQYRYVHEAVAVTEVAWVPHNIFRYIADRSDVKQANKNVKNKVFADGETRAREIEEDYLSIVEKGNFDEQQEWYDQFLGLGFKACPACGYTQSWQVRAKLQQTAWIVNLKIAVVVGLIVAVLWLWLDDTTIVKIGIYGVLAFLASAFIGAVFLRRGIKYRARSYEPPNQMHKPSIIKITHDIQLQEEIRV